MQIDNFCTLADEQRGSDGTCFLPCGLNLITIFSNREFQSYGLLEYRAVETGLAL